MVKGGGEEEPGQPGDLVLPGGFPLLVGEVLEPMEVGPGSLR
jgi:hypothetical protein